MGRRSFFFIFFIVFLFLNISCGKNDSGFKANPENTQDENTQGGNGLTPGGEVSSFNSTGEFESTFEELESLVMRFYALITEIQTLEAARAELRKMQTTLNSFQARFHDFKNGLESLIERTEAQKIQRGCENIDQDNRSDCVTYDENIANYRDQVDFLETYLCRVRTLDNINKIGIASALDRETTVGIKSTLAFYFVNEGVTINYSTCDL